MTLAEEAKAILDDANVSYVLPAGAALGYHELVWS
jgi:hypothetical protein